MENQDQKDQADPVLEQTLVKVEKSETIQEMALDSPHLHHESGIYDDFDFFPKLRPGPTPSMLDEMVKLIKRLTICVHNIPSRYIIKYFMTTDRETVEKTMHDLWIKEMAKVVESKQVFDLQTKVTELTQE